jgi:hypothetical protein
MGEQTTHPYDVFISYSSADKEWVQSWLLPHLEAEGLRVCIDFRDFDVGVPSIVNMERAVENSRHTLLVLTPAWVKSEWTEFEGLLTQTADPAARQRRLLPLLLESCETPRRIAMLTYVDFTKKRQWKKQLPRVVKAIRAQLSLRDLGPTLGKVSTASATRFLVPFPRNPDFVGRDEDLAALHAMLQQGNSPVGIRPTVLVGLGGIGKTQLAVEYAHAHRADYASGVFWINAINPLLLEFTTLAEQLELADADTPRDTAAQRCYEYLNQHRDALVIFDNVEEPRNLNVPFAAGLIPANLQCRTLFTTRKRDFPVPFQPFEVKTLPEPAAMHLLLRHPSRQPILEPNHPDHGLARVICITLGYLPLALALAGAFLGEYPEISLLDYRVRLLGEGAMDVVDASQVLPEDMPTLHETAVRATLKSSWDALTDEDARQALCAAGQLHEAELIPIPRLGLLTGLAVEAKPGYPVPLTQALKKLYTASLIEELTADRLRLHPLVHVFAAQLSPVAFRVELAARVATTFYDLAALQTMVIQRGIGDVLDDLQTGLELTTHDTEDDQVFTQLSSLEHVMGHEAHHLRDWSANANKPASFFLQQLRNWALELGYADLQKRVEVQLADAKLSATAKFHLQGRFAGFAVNGHIPLLFQFFETAASERCGCNGGWALGSFDIQ